MLERKANFIFQTRFASRNNFAANIPFSGSLGESGDNRFCKYPRRRNRIFMGILVSVFEELNYLACACLDAG